MCVGGIDGGERLKKKIRKRGEKEQFVSFCRRLHVLAGTFEGHRNGTPCTGTSEIRLLHWNSSCFRVGMHAPAFASWFVVYGRECLSLEL